VQEFIEARERVNTDNHVAYDDARHALRQTGNRIKPNRSFVTVRTGLGHRVSQKKTD
jgi:hypothetical protein